jgi:hypothetical protein
MNGRQKLTLIVGASTEFRQDPFLIRKNPIELSLVSEQPVQLRLIGFNPPLIRKNPSLVREDLSLVGYCCRGGHPFLLIDRQR